MKKDAEYPALQWLQGGDGSGLGGGNGNGQGGGGNGQGGGGSCQGGGGNSGKIVYVRVLINVHIPFFQA